MKTVALLMTLVVLASCERRPSQIAVQNDLEVDLEDVWIGSNSFGAVKAGVLSQFQPTRRAAANPFVHVESGTNGWHLRRPGDLALENGRYIYVISRSTKEPWDLHVECIKAGQP